jgi:(2R)-3-sulfolactate dehydrogenase (NADP+)
MPDRKVAHMSTVDRAELARLVERSLRRAGADSRAARVLTVATIEAELVGNRAVGVGHLFDYLDGYRQGRISTDARPEVTRVAPACIAVDAAQGLAQVAFEDAVETLVEASRGMGVATLWIRSSFTCGELGYYVRRLAEKGFVAVAGANSPALVSLGGSPGPVLGTNPLAYAVPRRGQPPLVIDQASSQTAYVNVRQAAQAGRPIPEGWAVDRHGAGTTDASAALEGALLAFGGHRGGNVALLVEILATLSGAATSLEAAPFDRGTTSPGIGVFVLCIDPATFAGSAERLDNHLRALRDDYGVRLPALEQTAAPPDHVEIDPDLFRRLRTVAEPGGEVLG